MLGLISVVGTTFRKCCAYGDRVPPNPMAFLPDAARLRRDLDIPQGAVNKHKQQHQSRNFGEPPSFEMSFQVYVMNEQQCA